MVLNKFELRKLRVPLGRKIGDNNCTYEAFDVCALTLVADDGTRAHGFGEKAHGGEFRKPVSWKAEMASEAALDAELKKVWPELKGRGAADLLAELPPPWQSWKVSNALHAALRMALWDLRGKAEGAPLHAVLRGGAGPDSLFSYVSPCAFPQTTEWVVDFFRRKVAEGFTAIKVKVGHPDIERDMERLRRIREAVGPEVEISVDGNTAWDAPGALQWMERVEREGIRLGYVEDPVVPDDLEGFRLLAKESPLPIIGHDYIPDPEKLRPLLDTGAIDRLRVRDGIDFGLAAAKVAAEYDLRLIQCNTFGEHGIHFAMAEPRMERMEFADLGWNDLFETPVGPVKGRLTAPPGPGLGLEPKAELLTAWRESAQNATSKD